MKPQQITIHKKKAVESGPDIRPPSGLDNLTWWMQQYFEHEVTTAPSSRKAQGQDIVNFFVFMHREEGSNNRILWTPRLSRAYLEYLRGLINEETGRRLYSDRNIDRFIAHLKTFSKWVYKCAGFPLGDPMKKVTTTKKVTGTGAWSLPWKNAGYDVRVITLPTYDVHTYTEYRDFIDRVFFVLAAPDCTHMSFARSTAKEPRDIKSSLRLVYRCKEIIDEIRIATIQGGGGMGD